MLNEAMTEIFEAVLTENQTYYSIGDSVKFSQEEVKKVNPKSEIGFDYGVITKLRGMDYVVKMDDGNEIVVPNGAAYAFGNADATPE